MTVFQIVIGFLLLSTWVIRPFLYKPAAIHFPAEMSSTFTGAWLVVGLALTFPLFAHLLVKDGYCVLLSPYALIAVYKGVSLFYLISLQQAINKTSTSSSVFLSFIALAIGALFNNIFFHENLTLIRLICIVGFGVLGIAFLKKGDAKNLSAKDKYFFLITTLIMASYTVSDHVAIPQMGWYPYLLVSSLALFVCGIIYTRSVKKLKVIFTNKMVVCAGIFYTVSEFLVIYASINILPVSIVGVFLRLSVPIVMLISAIKYKEQNLKNQLGFGIAAILLALPILLTK